MMRNPVFKFASSVLAAGLFISSSAFGAATTPPDDLGDDLTVNDSSKVSTTATGQWVRPAANAFDNGTAHNNDDRTIYNGTTVDWIYTFDSPTVVNAYKLYCPSTTPYYYDKRMPKYWTFQAKNASDSEWTVLDTQAGESGWSALESRYYAFENTTAYDSYRFAVTANQGSDGYVQFDELEFFYYSASDPVLGDLTLARTGANTYSIQAVESANEADLYWVADDGTSATTNLIQSAVAEGATATGTISGLTADKTYQISVLATNASGADLEVAGTLYTGELTLGATTDANEIDLVAGGVVVSRASAAPWDLVVNYTISSSATGAAEGTTWAAPTAVTIPAGEMSATLPVTPIQDLTIEEDIEVTVALANGNYEIPSVSSATLTLISEKPLDEGLFSKKLVFTVSGYAGNTALTDFPVLVKISTDISGFSYSDLVSADGADLRFADSDGYMAFH